MSCVFIASIGLAKFGLGQGRTGVELELGLGHGVCGGV